MEQESSTAAEPSEITLTGERTLPGVPAENYWFRRHEAAYGFAARWAGGTVLDAGSGEGYGAAMLARSADLIGMELDAETSAHSAHRYSRVRVLRADACRIPFRPSSFDAVVAMQVLEHLWCPERFVEQVRDALKPSGTFLLSTPNRETFSPDGTLNPFHTHEYTADELERLLRASFERVELLGVHSGKYLRSLDILAAGSLQHLLMGTAFEDLPSKISTGIRLVRADHFVVGPAKGSLDLLAVAT
jgi:SAM-dependent methyltransferase